MKKGARKKTPKKLSRTRKDRVSKKRTKPNRRQPRKSGRSRAALVRAKRAKQARRKKVTKKRTKKKRESMTMVSCGSIEDMLSDEPHDTRDDDELARDQGYRDANDMVDKANRFQEQLDGVADPVDHQGGYAVRPMG